MEGDGGVSLAQALSENGEIGYKDKTLLQFVHSQYDQPGDDSSIFALIGIKKSVSLLWFAC